MADRGMFTYLAIGVGAVLLSPALFPVALHVSKPLIKGLVRGGMILYQNGLQAYAEVAESTQDIVAEVTAEMAAKGNLINQPDQPSTG